MNYSKRKSGKPHGSSSNHSGQKNESMSFRSNRKQILYGHSLE
jgi:hypothetical protein